MYNILQLASTSNNTNFWSFLLDSNNEIYETNDLVVLESKLKELLVSVPASKLKVVAELKFEEDLIFDT